MNTVHLVENEPVATADEEVVRFCQRMLQSARDGDFHGIAVTTVQLDGERVTAVGSGYAGRGMTEHRHTALGGVVDLQARLARDLLEQPK